MTDDLQASSTSNQQDETLHKQSAAEVQTEPTQPAMINQSATSQLMTPMPLVTSSMSPTNTTVTSRGRVTVQPREFDDFVTNL
jgi:hypothetical protein